MGKKVRVPVVSGPLAPYAAGYGSWLATRGYSRWTVAHRLWQLDLLSRWLEREGLSPSELTTERVEAFLVARRAAGYSSWVSVRSTVLPLAYLCEVGVVPVEVVRDCTLAVCVQSASVAFVIGLLNRVGCAARSAGHRW